jgi:hypothetical protein
MALAAGYPGIRTNSDHSSHTSLTIHHPKQAWDRFIPQVARESSVAPVKSLEKTQIIFNYAIILTVYGDASVACPIAWVTETDHRHGMEIDRAAGGHNGNNAIIIQGEALVSNPARNNSHLNSHLNSPTLTTMVKGQPS